MKSKLLARIALLTAAVSPLVATVDATTIEADTTFNAPFIGAPFTPARAVALPGGKIISFFNVNTLSDQLTGPIVRYNTNGTIDNTFHFSSDYDFVTAVALTPTGQLIVAAHQSIYKTIPNTGRILRLNADGSIDNTFSAAAIISGVYGDAGMRGITIQPDGKILLAGHFFDTAGAGHPRVVRLNTNGTVDSSFAAVTMTQGASTVYEDAYGLWGPPALQLDGKIIIVGDFASVNGTSCPGVARLNSDGSLDSSFNASGFTRSGVNPGRAAIVLADGKIAVAGRFNVGASKNVPLLRLNTNGSIDPTWNLITGRSRMNAIALQPDGKIIGVDTATLTYRFNTDGTLDPGFHQATGLAHQMTPAQGFFSVDLLSDGRFIVAGSFTDVDDEGIAFNGSRYGVARFNSDGTVDPTFLTARRTANRTTAKGFLRLADGQTLIAYGDYSSTNDTVIPHNFGRLAGDGSLQSAYDPVSSFSAAGNFGPDFVALGFEPLADGELLLFGYKDLTSYVFTYGKVHTDGTEDASFHPDAAVGNVDAIFGQADGKLIVYSSYGQDFVNGTEVRRLNADGSVDAAFQLDPAITAAVTQRDSGGNLTALVNSGRVLATLPGDKVLFGYAAMDHTFKLVVLLPTGNIDPSFPPASFPVTFFAPSLSSFQDPGTGHFAAAVSVYFADPVITAALPVGSGKIVLLGNFASYRGTPAHGIVRTNGDGTLDPTFDAGGGAQWLVTSETATAHPGIDSFAVGLDGKLVLVGTFEAIDGVTLPGIAVLNPDGSVDPEFTPPVTRDRYSNLAASVRTQPDGSFLLTGPYLRTGDLSAPALLRLINPVSITSASTASATTEEAFTYQIVAPNADRYQATGLAPGLSLNAKLGVISGTPSHAGSFTVLLTASNAQGSVAAKTLALKVQAPPSSFHPSINSGSVTDTTHLPFSYQVIVTGVTSAATIQASGLPAGLTIDGKTGLISGTPSQDGSYSVGLTVIDGNASATGTLQLTFTSDPGLPVISSADVVQVNEIQPVTYHVTAPGSDAPNDPTLYTLVGTLPAGLTFDPATGVISGTVGGGTAIKAMHTAGTHSKASVTSAGSVLSTVQIFTRNSHGTAASTLTFVTGKLPGVVNISTRVRVGTDSDVLIGGFIVTGTAPKKVLIRAIGPSLAAQNVPGALQDTVLELHNAQSLIASNDDWRTGGQKQAIIDTTIPPSNDHESALIATLQPGKYTAVVSGKDSSTGVALVEIYDLDPAADSQMANLSTRGKVLTDSDVMIGGFIVSGGTAKILVRAIGPELTAAGVQGALADTTLELHGANGALLAANDDWRSDQEQAIKDTTVPPTNERESAIVRTLGAGKYTAIVHGKNGTTGVALVEIYALQ